MTPGLCKASLSHRKKDPPHLFFQERKNNLSFESADHFCSATEPPWSIGPRTPQPLGTSNRVYVFKLLGFSSLPLHMGRASALQTFVVGRTTGVPSISLPKSQGNLVLLSQLGTLHLSTSLFLICTVEITVLPLPIGILQTEISEYSPWD